MEDRKEERPNVYERIFAAFLGLCIFAVGSVTYVNSLKSMKEASEASLEKTLYALSEQICDTRGNNDGRTSLDEWKPVYTEENWRNLNVFGPIPPSSKEINTFLEGYRTEQRER
ncbi:hypothetical protein CMI41_02775 [Candidatus Pacearchaeota archaeon]|nr:hypothetical protein [Candidatus Pacearchaeota archaeon]|tara:strand:- start:3340 stop:3681 length:342 start_codon:yes stop_codon:yes gene_type:complete